MATMTLKEFRQLVNKFLKESLTDLEEEVEEEGASQSKRVQHGYLGDQPADYDVGDGIKESVVSEEEEVCEVGVGPAPSVPSPQRKRLGIPSDPGNPQAVATMGPQKPGTFDPFQTLDKPKPKTEELDESYLKALVRKHSRK